MKRMWNVKAKVIPVTIEAPRLEWLPGTSAGGG